MKAKHHLVVVSAFILLCLSIAGCATSSDRSKNECFIAEYHGPIAVRQILRLVKEHGLTQATVAGSEDNGTMTVEGSQSAKARSVIAKAIKDDGLDAVILYYGLVGNLPPNNALEPMRGAP